jgi:hypothetical protein
MKTKLLFVAAVLAVVSFSSCKKEELKEDKSF